jgi:RES domain-containing protein
VSVVVWRIATDTPVYVADDLSGAGAERSGGRWNSPGRPLVYASSSIALACLKTVVHLNATGLPLNRFLVRIEVPDPVWNRRQVQTPDTLPVGWSAIPEGRVSMDVGDAWLKGLHCAILLVPSVIVPEETNVLINPRHPDAQRVVARKLRPWYYDGRLR